MTGAEVTDASLARAADLAPRFRDLDALLVHVATAEPTAVAAPPSDALLQLFDPGRSFHRSLGLDGPGVIDVDANRRLRAVIPAGSPDQALALCRARREETRTEVVRSHAPVLLIPRVLDASLYRALIGYWERSHKKENAVASRSGAGSEDATIKRRVDTVVQDRALYDAVKRCVERRVMPEMMKCFNFEAVRMEALRIGCYDATANGAFGRHRDNMTPYTAHRRYAMSLNLNRGYEGGAVAFPEYGRQIYAPDAGDAIVFSCSLVHEALPVTAGRRFGLFTFFTDRSGAAQEDAMIAKRGAEIPAYSVE